jgi:phage-related protein
VTVIGEAFVEVKPKTEGFAGATEKGVSKGLGGVATKLAIGFGAALATGAAAHFVSGFIKAGAESEKISRVTGALIKSTGGAAQLSADQVGNLATKLSDLSGVDDELIQSSENILLTFTNIKDAAGAGNDIFSRTSAAALDMATVLGGDATASIQLLGKALNDPAEGLSKLTRAGVVFTDQQKEQIKTLQASGDVLGAQKVILDEVNKEFGGAAAAAADPFKRLSVVVDNLKEAIGSALIPVLAPAAQGLANLITAHTADIAGALTGALHAMGAACRFLEPGIRNVAGAFKFLADQLTPLIAAVGTFVSDHLPSLSSSLSANTPLVEHLSTAVVALGTALGGLLIVGAVSAKFDPLITTLKALSTLVPALGTSLGALLGPLGLAVAAIAAGAIAGELLFQKVDAVRGAFESLFGKTLAPFAAALTFLNPFVPLAVGAKFLFDNVAPVHDAVEGLVSVFHGLASAAGDLVGGLNLGDVFGGLLGSLSGLSDSVGPALASIGDTVAGVGTAISDGFSTAVTAIRSGIGPAINFLTGVWAKYGDQVTGILVGFRDIAVAVFERAAALVGVFARQLAIAAGVIADAFGPALAFIASTVEIALAPLGAVLSGVLQVAQIAIQTFIAVVVPIWTTAWSLFSDIVSNVIGPIGDVIEGLLGVIQGVVDIVAGIFTGDWGRIWDGFKEIANSAMEIVTGILQGFLGFLAAIWANATDLITLPFTVAWAVLQGAIAAALAIAQAAFQGFLDFLTAVWTNATTLITAPVQIAWAILQGLLADIVNLFTALPGQITDALASFPSLLIDLGTKLIHGLKSGIDSAMAAVSGFFSGLGDAIVGFVGDLGSKLIGAGASVIDGFKSGVDAAFGAVIHFFSGLPDQIVGFLGDVGGILLQKGIDFVQGLIDGIERKAKDIPGIVAGILSELNPLNAIPFSVPGQTGASGMVIPGQPGQPFPMIAHGAELLLNPKQQANLMWNLANTPAVVKGSNGGAGGDTFIDARFVNEGTIFGVADLEAVLDAHSDRLADIVSSGRRGSLG